MGGTYRTHEIDGNSVTTPEGNRPVGRPWLMWVDGVDLEDRMYGRELDSVYDEVQWRGLVNMVMCFLVL
jgi:hypothetical protein